MQKAVLSIFSSLPIPSRHKSHRGYFITQKLKKIDKEVPLKQSLA